jgi:hypothetical protein
MVFSRLHNKSVAKYKYHRGYSMLFDEYEIYFTIETRFLIFSRFEIL